MDEYWRRIARGMGGMDMGVRRGLKLVEVEVEVLGGSVFSEMIGEAVG